MYVAVSIYTAPIDEIDYVLPEHVEWLNRHIATGDFLMSGRRDQRVGGVILARPMLRGKLDAILATDPFSYRNLTKYEVYEFSVRRTAPELNWLNELVTTE